MTEWIPVNMHPVFGSNGENERPVFRFRCKVPKGFKYRYWFVCRGKKVLDYETEVSMRDDNVPTNVIEVKGDIEENSEMEDLS